MPYGTHPLIDNEINFAGSTVYHDLGDLDRLEKINLITRVCKQNDLAIPRLRVCWGNDKEGGNCTRCEKCLRTINELLIMEKNPKDFGFELGIKTAIKLTQDFFNTNLTLKTRQLWHWECLQNKAAQKIEVLELSLKNHWIWVNNLHLERFAKSPTEITRWRYQDPELAALWRKSIKKIMYCR